MFISVSILQRVLSYASTKDINPEDLLKSEGVDPLILRDTDNKIALEDYYRVLEKAIELTGDPNFGLHMGEQAELGDLSILGYIMANCGDIGEALKKACKYFALISTVLNMNMSIKRNYARLTFHMTEHLNQSKLRHCIDAALASYYNLIKKITSTDVRIKEVWIISEDPEDPGEYKRIFNCPILFNQPIAAIVFSEKYLKTPIIHPNPELLLLLERHASSFLCKINANNEISKRVSLLLFNQIKGSNPSIEEVAKKLGISIRVLQKRLSQEGVTFSQLTTHVRKELAKRYLSERLYSVDDITYLLGFSEPSVFRRAFKVWTGLTPGQYRLSLLDKPYK